MESESDVEDGGCYLWYETLAKEHRAPTHDECEQARCLWVDYICGQCVRWEQGCAPAGKPKITPRNRYVMLHYNRKQGSGIDMFGLPSNKLPRWIAYRLDTLVAETEKQKQKREAELYASRQDRG